MVFLRKTSHHTAHTFLVSLVDLLQDTPTVAAMWPMTDSETLSEWMSRTVITTGYGEPATVIDRALATKKIPPLMRPTARLEFDRSLMMSWNAWHHGDEIRVAIKGAPEQLLHYANLTENEHEAIRLQMAKMARGGHQILAVAHTTMAQTPDSGQAILDTGGIVLDGLVALEYPAQSNLSELLEHLHSNAQSIKLISGESVEMIAELAAKWKITKNLEVFDCRHLATLGNEAVNRAQSVDLFARVDAESLGLLLTALATDGSLAATPATQRYFQSMNPDLPSMKTRDLL